MSYRCRVPLKESKFQEFLRFISGISQKYLRSLSHVYISLKILRISRLLQLAACFNGKVIVSKIVTIQTLIGLGPYRN